MGKYLHAVALDGSLLVSYDLSDIREDPNAGFPRGDIAMCDSVPLSRAGGAPVQTDVKGHSAVAAFEDFLYIAFRTTSQVIRVPLESDGAVKQPIVAAELIAEFDPWDPKNGRSANLIDLAFNSKGELFVSAASGGIVWVFKPDPNNVFDGKSSKNPPNTPYLKLPEYTGHPKAKTANIAVDDQDRLYICSGTNDAGGKISGTVYRAV
ncbi:MAG: hypothetical protein AAGD06_20300 [Acidobacteriota bacterium]